MSQLCGSFGVFTNVSSGQTSFHIQCKQMVSLLCGPFHESLNVHFFWSLGHILSRYMVFLQSESSHLSLKNQYQKMQTYIWCRQLSSGQCVSFHAFSGLIPASNATKHSQKSIGCKIWFSSGPCDKSAIILGQTWKDPYRREATCLWGVTII